jgi:hypothetical protein
LRLALVLRLALRPLQADALDFFGDAANYAIVIGMVLRYRAMAALAKGSTMGRSTR